ncbi:MAG: hypothetical protein HYZ81_10355 [Nitrospinae bacterium]|nr:hypothetical protein [Nitrospinota bacterium]
MTHLAAPYPEREATLRRTVLRLALTLVIFMVATTTYGPVAVAQQATKMRWDIITLTSFTPPTLKEGGVAFASATDGSFMKLTGSGTLGIRRADPVTGRGEWETFDVGNKSTGKGAYTVTGLVSFTAAPGTLPPQAIDTISDKADARSGLAVMRIAYTKEDGSPVGTGILVLSCHQPVGAPDAIFEGVIASQGYGMDFHHALTMHGVDANHPVFHVAR